jgi:hypothetical protein
MYEETVNKNKNYAAKLLDELDTYYNEILNNY